MGAQLDEVRERALSYGPATLSDSELVSIVATIPVERARALFAEVGGLNKLASCDVETIANGKCAGPVKGLIRSAAFKLGRRNRWRRKMIPVPLPDTFSVLCT